MPSEGLARRLRRILMAWMLVHLGVAALFALCPHKAGFWHYVPHELLAPVRIYGGFTGATGSYGFFSPDVSPELRTRFVLATERGEIAIPLFPPMNHEAELRVGNLVDAQWEFGTTGKALEKNRALAASYAGKLLDRHPEARAVTVLVEYFKLPPIAAGPTPPTTWTPHYQARFERPAQKPLR